MKPCHRSRPVPPPASCRSGLDSQEASQKKWNLLRDEEAHLCTLNQWWGIRRHDVSADAAGRLSAAPFRWQKLHWKGAARSKLQTTLAAASSGMVPRAQTGDHQHSFGPHAAHLGVRQDCDRSAGRGLPNLRSGDRADPEISQEKQEFTASAPPAASIGDPLRVPTQPAGRRAAVPPTRRDGSGRHPVSARSPPVTGSIN